MSSLLRHKILLVDEHQMMCDGLKEILEKQPDFVVCGQVFEATEVLPAVLSLQPNVVLLDINLHGINGIDIRRKILTDFPAVKVLMLTMYDQTKLLDETRRASWLYTER